MTDNEKRAHDLSTALLSKAIEFESTKSAINGESGVDGFEIYMKNYKAALELFNREFPNDK